MKRDRAVRMLESGISATNAIPQSRTDDERKDFGTIFG